MSLHRERRTSLHQSESPQSPPRVEERAKAPRRTPADAALDSSNHVLVAHFNGSPSDYEDVIAKLGDHGVLSQALRDRLRGLGGFRNILVHGYLDIDRRRVYQALQIELEDLIAFADELETFLDRIEA